LDCPNAYPRAQKARHEWKQASPGNPADFVSSVGIVLIHCWKQEANEHQKKTREADCSSKNCERCIPFNH